MADSVVKTKKTRAIRQKGKAFRQQEPLLAVLQWGVNHCINELLCVPEKQLLLQQDFKAHHKININNQYYNDHELPSKFKVKEYCPLVFRDIRQRFQEDPDDYLYSLCDGPLSSRESSGRSGATFHTSHDLRLVLKTLSKDEVSQFHLTFQDYHTHIVECGGQTLLPRYLGMYRLTVQERDTYVIVMASVLSSQTDVVPRLFDLKVGRRRASDHELDVWRGWNGVPVFRRLMLHACLWSWSTLARHGLDAMWGCALACLSASKLDSKHKKSGCAWLR
eukprot:TRINITY_DN10573_c0_g1_i1.p1 TRINITY_DN10573_c0_g1~~TRINITY_DN10573_c0_g1_i1.p1  ORF type:complete len:277 (+),score=30.83 TRINITY_DN10573_c0_g1_i1:208-1038(+)